MAVEKNKETKESKEFWSFVEKTSAAVNSWPDWKKYGENVSCVEVSKSGKRTETISNSTKSRSVQR